MRLAALLLSLGACTMIAPGTARDLATLDPLTADPAGVAVALLLPAAVLVMPDGAVMTIGARHGAVTREERFVLVSAPAPDLPPPLPGGQVISLTLAEADHTRLRALQAAIADWKAAGETEGTLAFGLAACATAPLTGGDAAALIRLGSAQPYQPLIGPLPLARLLGDAALVIGPCPATP